MKRIYMGLEDSGKSYKLAKDSVKVLERNKKWYARTGIPRPIVSNLPYSSIFSDMCTEAGIPLYHWKNLEELVNWKNTGKELTGCDLFIDEVGTYFDARTFKDLPLEIRLWLAQASKMGVDIYGAAQDFAQVDLAFRRLTNELFEVRKIAGNHRPHITKPPVKFIWGVGIMQEIDPRGYKEEEAQVNTISFPRPFLFKKALCEIFATNIRIPRSAAPPFRHIARKCEIPGCDMARFQITHGVKHKIQHV